MSGPHPIPVTFYTKPGCHLCDDAADELAALAARFPLDVHVVDITRDLEVHRRFWDKIPVVEVAGRTLQAPIAADELRAAVGAIKEPR